MRKIMREYSQAKVIIKKKRTLIERKKKNTYEGNYRRKMRTVNEGIM